MQDYQIREVDWQEAQHELKRVREKVFIVEQNVPVELEWDGLDPDARHVLAQSRSGEAMGTARLLPDGQRGTHRCRHSARKNGSVFIKV
ncbi:MAG: hypothetical protein ACREUJ_04610 [Burkholderiales bacterium]